MKVVGVLGIGKNPSVLVYWVYAKYQPNLFISITIGWVSKLPNHDVNARWEARMKRKG